MIFNSPNNRKTAVIIIGVTLSYLILAMICLTFGISFGNVSPIWLPTGIAAFAILTWRYPVLPAIWLGTFLSVLTTEVSAGTAALFASGNSIEALVFFYLYQRYGEQEITLDTPRHTFRFLGISGCCCLFAAGIGVLTLFVQGYIPAEVIPLNSFTWWLGDLTGILLVAPLLVSWHTVSLKGHSREKWGECIGYYLLLLIGSVLIFSGSSPYLFLLFILYAVFRCSLLHVMATIIIGDLVAVSLTVLQTGAFAGVLPNQNLLSIQLFIATISITGLLLYAALQERKTALAR